MAIPSGERSSYYALQELARAAEEVTKNPSLYLIRTKEGKWKAQAQKPQELQIGKIYEALESDIRGWVEEAKKDPQGRKTIARISQTIRELSSTSREAPPLRARLRQLSKDLQSLGGLPKSPGLSKISFNSKTTNANDLKRYLQSESAEELVAKLKSIGIGSIDLDFSGRTDYAKLAAIFKEAGSKYGGSSDEVQSLVSTVVKTLERDNPENGQWLKIALEKLENEERSGKPGYADLKLALQAALLQPANLLTKAWVQAVRAGRSDISEMLEKAGLNINARYSNGMTEIVEAVIARDADLVMKLLNSGADVKSVTESGNSALGYTVRKAGFREDNVKMALAILSRGADVNQKNILGRTPLFVAATRGSCELVETFLKAGADIDTQDDKGISAIRSTAEKLQTEDKKDSDEELLEVIYKLLDARDAPRVLKSMSQDNRERLLGIAYREADPAKLKILERAGISRLTFETDDS